MADAESDIPPSRPADGVRDEAKTVNRPRIARRPPSAGSVLPTVTDDERDVGWGDAPEGDDDERLRREVPPHHGT